MQDETIGLLLALSSSIFIGASFIIKKKGLRLAGASGLRAGKLSSLCVNVRRLYAFVIALRTCSLQALGAMRTCGSHFGGWGCAQVRGARVYVVPRLPRRLC